MGAERNDNICKSCLKHCDKAIYTCCCKRENNFVFARISPIWNPLIVNRNVTKKLWQINFHYGSELIKCEYDNILSKTMEILINCSLKSKYNLNGFANVQTMFRKRNFADEKQVI